ncbi:MAG: recombinase family protein [Ruminococcus sp.]|nr:recombinase family protein [Ruminococcus sp.]MDY4909470.1 recombinase family protein [Candidatus Fimenecus sp.]
MFANHNGRRIAIRVWLYSRLSRDEDDELNSLKNQQNIIREYAEKNCYTIVGESFDDNVSGMHFNREGVNKIYEAVESKLIDAVIVKDMSRLGRHKTQTALFIDYLRENDVKVLSVTENLDTSNENDDLIIGFKGLFNDMYARDISRKVRAGFLQKQKEGLVMIPPMGYFKDKNTGEILIMDEPANIVRRIFQMYLDGYGLKNIAHKLNDEGLKTPAYYQLKYLNKHQGYNKPEITTRYLWNGTAVKRILTNEFYCGNLVNHKYMLDKINRQRKTYSTDEQIRHENAVPAIVSKEIFDKVQFLLESKKKDNVRATFDKPYHRYTGLIKCGDCGASFSCKIRKWKDKPDRIEYVCNSYHRYGKEHCSSHRINETVLDEIIYAELLNIRNQALENFKQIDAKLNLWKQNKSLAQNNIEQLNKELSQRKSDQQEILLERLRDKERANIYTQMLEKCESDIKNLTDRIAVLENMDATIKKRKAEISSSIEIFNKIIDDGTISDSDLRMLIDKIEISETDGKLDISITLNGKFKEHRLNYNELKTLNLVS